MGFYITMDYAIRMGVFQSFSYIKGYLDRCIDRQMAVFFNIIF